MYAGVCEVVQRGGCIVARDRGRLKPFATSALAAGATPAQLEAQVGGARHAEDPTCRR